MHVLKEYPYKLLTKYPGMRPKDVVIWEEYILNHPDSFLRVWYDVHIGDPKLLIPKQHTVQDSGMYDVSRWCIDVLAETENFLFVIEIKPDALAGALGQALAYRALLEKIQQFAKPLHPVVLTDNVSPITRQAANLLKVSLLTP